MLELSYGHKATNCPSSPVCSRYANNHKTSECQKKIVYRCINNQTKTNQQTLTQITAVVENSLNSSWISQIEDRLPLIPIMVEIRSNKRTDSNFDLLKKKLSSTTKDYEDLLGINGCKLLIKIDREFATRVTNTKQELLWTTQFHLCTIMNRPDFSKSDLKMLTITTVASLHTQKKVKESSIPWIILEILNQIKKRDIFFKKQARSPNEITSNGCSRSDLYNASTLKVSSMIRKAKQIYFQKQVNQQIATLENYGKL